MKICITGADGALGSELQSVLRSEKVNFLATDIKQLDLTYHKKVSESLLNYRPDIILHLAAISDVDACETNPDLAYRVNVLATAGLAVIARKIAARILYVSTNFIFDGTASTPYLEYDTPNPINAYGRTKYYGEKCIRDQGLNSYIIRTSWLFGMNAKNFISKFLQSRDKPSAISAICDQTGSFTYIPDLARAIFSIIKTENYGIYHVVNAGFGSWVDFALKAQDLSRFTTEIQPIKLEELNLPARRPPFAPLASKNLEYFFDLKMRRWDAALADFISQLKKSERAPS